MSGHELNLIIRPDSDVRRRIDAWFIPGHNAVIWLTALTRECVDTEGTRFRIIDDEQGQTLGAVVTGVGDTAGPGWLPYSKAAGNLFIPAASQFFPFVSDAELTAKLTGGSVSEFVWHPTCGLIGFEEAQILTCADLLAGPRRSERPWDTVQPGPFLNDRLVSVSPIESLTPEQILVGGRDDIGSDAENLDDVPKSPDESATAGLQDFAAKMMSPLANAANWIARHAPAGATSPTWINAIENWAEKILQHAAVNQSKRLNELKRLLSMLNSDPDKGLRYAIPFGGDGAPRGIATPSNNLGPHGVDFGWDHGGGAPADYWNIPPAIAAELIRRYQELALREKNLGRCRRAAYIYATLLNDYSAAAQVLAEGGFHREAAEVYRRKLNQPRRAAECLLNAGLWQDAVDIYTELKDWVSVAQTLEKLGETVAARNAWRHAATEFEDGQDFIRAAAIHEKNLCNNAAAADLLDRGWNQAPNANECLRELLGLHARTQNHAVAEKLIDKLHNDETLPVSRQQAAARILSDVSQKYPDADVRAIAFDGSRRLIARNLLTADARDGEAFLRILQALLPDDRLLPRDCQRFTEQSETQRKKRTGDVQCIFRTNLRVDVQWQAAVRSGSRTFVAGYTGDSLLLASFANGKSTQIEYGQWYVRRERQQKILLVPNANEIGSVFLHVVGLNVAERDFTYKRSVVAIRVRNLPWPDSSVNAAGVSKTGMVWTMNLFDSSLEIQGNEEKGSPIVSRMLPVFPGELKPPMFIQPFQDGQVCCAVEQSLVQVAPTTTIIEEFGLSQGAVGMCSLEDRVSPRVAVLFAEGGIVHWLHSPEHQPFGQGLSHPVATFLENEDLVVAGEDGLLEIYRTRNEQLKLAGAYADGTRRAVAALPSVGFGSGDTNEFMLISADGTVDVFEYQS